MVSTIGELKASVATMGERAWRVAPELKDDDPIPQFPTGGDLSQIPLARDVPPLNLPDFVSRPVANPLLRARNLQIQADLQAEVHIGVDWRTRWGGNWLATMQDQNPCLSCWAFATAALVETMVRIEHGVWAKRSEGDLRDGWGGPTGENWVVRDGPKATPCAHGAGVTGALDWVTANGIADPDCYAWSSVDKNYSPTADRNGRTVRVPKYTSLGSVDDAKRWLDSVGPVIAGFDAYDEFSAYTGPDVYHQSPMAANPQGHIMLVVGYDDGQQCWIVRNSWGAGWGMGGYGLVGFGECKIDAYSKQGLTGTNPDPWTKRRLHTGNFFESGNGPEHRNFEMVRASAPRARHLWRDGGSGGFVWAEAATLENPNDIAAGAGCVGEPAATSTTYDRNFEAVYWELSGQLRHWWMGQDDKIWHDGGRFGPTDTEGFPALIQSNYGAPGNLEVVVRRRGGILEHWWREGAPNFVWHGGGTITDEVKMSGPSLVQANIGTQGNLYLACVSNFGTMQLWWRDDDGDHTWKRGEVFGHRVGETPICMIQGQFGATDELTPGNFELCVAVNGQVQHWWRDNSALRSEIPRADFANPLVSDVAHLKVDGPLLAHASDRKSVPDDLQILLADKTNEVVARATRSALGNVTLGRMTLGKESTTGESLANSSAGESHVKVSDPIHAATVEPMNRWHQSATFGHDVKHVWGLLQGSFGFNLEVIVETTDGALQHYYRSGDGWHEAEVVDA